jgi:phosphoribosylformylglycinamidine synthase subunit PurSL
MTHRVEIYPAEGFGDPHADSVLHSIAELGIDSVTAVRSARLFFLFGQLDDAAVETIAADLLADPVSERYHIGSSDPAGRAVIEVHLQPGVMDPVANSACGAIEEMGIAVDSVRTARRYELAGDLSQAQLETIATKLLANGVIEDVFYQAHTPGELESHDYQLDVIEVPIRDLDEVGLEKLSTDGDLFLNLHEMRAIQDHYRQLGREPRDIELEMIAQTWSEHCGHKTFRSDVELTDGEGKVLQSIPNLLKSTVFGSTKELDKPWCLNVFEDNAGVIAFDEDNAVCFKVETHNHPSAIEPYGGASTGIGGVIRDPLGTGLGARPVANTDIFCFGPTEMNLADVPRGVLHPRRVMRGVVSGVRDYGNRMGIPTVNGAVYFDEKYLGNPLVFCGTLAVMPNSMATKRQPNPGDAVVVVGGRTGRDGIHGATFSSGELTHEHETEFSHAVQIGNAITEKKVLDCLLQARDRGLYSCITDCGAGGLSSAVGEMGEKTGATIHLDRVPLKYAGLSYDEIWISEAQERMVLAVPQGQVAELLALFEAEKIEATVIGEYGCEIDSRATLTLHYGDTQVGQVDMDFLHEGCPRPTKQAVYDKPDRPSPAVDSFDGNDVLTKILAAPNVASKEWIIRQYDHEVQGGSVVKPLVGVTGDGPADAAVIRPLLHSRRGVALSCGMNPRLGELDAYHSALHAVDECLRNITAVGADLDRTAILDNFCWGNCNKPDRMGSFTMAAIACRDAALAYGTPFVSGKDSLNNEFQTDSGETIAIPPTLLISAFGIVGDVDRCVTSDFKSAGHAVFLVGATRGELGGSHLLDALKLETGTDVPPVDPALSRKTMAAMQQAIAAGLIRACHDLSEGGLAVAAAEMAFAGGFGVSLDPSATVTEGDACEAAVLFGESAGRFLVEVAPENVDAFTAAMRDVACARLGEVTDTGQVAIGSAINLSIDQAKAAWQGTFNW